VTELIDRANEILDRLSVLDDEIANGRALRALLEDLNERSGVGDSHVAAIRMVRAGILRATVSSIMACLDSARHDRASIGQLFALLEDGEVLAVFTEEPRITTLQQAKAKYDALVESELFDRARSFRNAAIAHLLSDPIPAVTYETFYELYDVAEQLTISLFEVCGSQKPLFPEYHKILTTHAKIFWDTYFEGMRGRPTLLGDDDQLVSSELEPARERRSLEMAILQIENNAPANQLPRNRAARKHPMHAFLAACIIAAVLAIAGYYGLSLIQEPVSKAFSTDAVRLD
jgi:hypothetical protein